MLCEQIEGIEVVKAFNDPQKLLTEYQDLDFDLCILDIEMPGMNGLDVARSLNNKLIIFTTAYKEFAAEAFDLDAIDYIRKPIPKERLEKAIEKAISALNSNKKEKQYFQLNTSRGKTIIHYHQLSYIKTSEIDSRDKIAILTDGTNYILKNISFKELEELLPKTSFIRINKQEIISIKIVSSFSLDVITTTILTPLGKPLTLSLSDVYKNSFLQKIKR